MFFSITSTVILATFFNLVSTGEEPNAFDKLMLMALVVISGFFLAQGAFAVATKMQQSVVELKRLVNDDTYCRNEHRSFTKLRKSILAV
jgi:hypothetical protein